MRNDVASVLVGILVTGCSTGAGVLPPGTVVASVHDDAVLDAQIDEGDGIDRLVPRTHGFAEGEPAYYWDLGQVPTASAMPMYRLCRVNGGSCDPIAEHPAIAERLPGDEGFSHYGRLFEVAVTATYAGQLITSRAAIDSAVAQGLVVAPEETPRVLHCPIVHRDARIDLGDGAMASPVPIYVDGREARCFDFTATHGIRRLADTREEGLVLVRNVYPLTRMGETTPIHERARGMDLTGDDDVEDTNNILGAAFGTTGYTPLWLVVPVVVAADYMSIDTAMDQDVATYRDAHDMFTINADYELEPIAGRTVSYEITEILVDCPIQSAAGQL